MTSPIENPLPRKRKNKLKRIGIIVGLLITTVAVVVAAFFWGVTDKTDSILGPSGTHKKINILLLGIDQRKNDIGRSNVTCVVTVDPDTKKVSMVWVPRDSRVKIPGHGWNKIGHAYAYGGPKLSEQTVSDLLGIPIDYYVDINMDGFKKVIDALGGVDINVDKRMYYYDPYDEGEVDNDGLIDLQPGLQHMDGNVALQYVRFRHDEMGDIGRIERQQKFAKALLADIMTPAIIIKIPGVIQEANLVFKTDMPVSQMLSLSKVLNDAYKQGFSTDMVTGKPVYIDDISYWVPDIVAMRKQIAQLQGTTIDDAYLAAAQTLAQEYAASFPKETTTSNVTAGSSTEHSTTAPSKVPAANSKPQKVPTNTAGPTSPAAKVVPSATGSEADTGAVRKSNVNAVTK